MTGQRQLKLITRGRHWGVLAAVVVALALARTQAPVVCPLPAAEEQAVQASVAVPNAEDGAQFYVDPDSTGPVHDGSAAAPWKDLGSSPTGAQWAAINHALGYRDVVVWFSARSAGSDTNQISPSGINVARTDKSDHRLTLDGMSVYNSDDGQPKWVRHEGPSRLEIRYGYPISAYIPGTNQDRVTIRGFKAIGGFGGRGGQALAYWGGSHVLIENCEFLHDPAAKDGACVQFGYAWSEAGKRQNGGCTDIVIRNNVVHDTFGEGIYVGGSGNTRDPATGKVRPAHSRVLIEGNRVYNTGIRGAEGDCIDVKDGLSDVIIRNNICHHTQGGNATGISSHSPFTAEGNVIYSARGHGISFGTYWGSGVDGAVLRHNLIFNNGKSGIYMSSERGRPVTATLIENNTLYGNRGAGLAIGVNLDGSITGLQVRRNIFSRNAPGIGGYGRPSCVIAGNDFHANQPDYGWPFRVTDDRSLAGQNLAYDPEFANPEDPAGPDGQFMTEDDGLLAKALAPASGPAGGQPRLGYLPSSTRAR